LLPGYLLPLINSSNELKTLIADRSIYFLQVFWVKSESCLKT
jgi:hypothetical protein